MNTTNVNKSTLEHALAYFLDYHFQDELLLDVSHQSMRIIGEELNDRFGDLVLSENNIKHIWIEWFSIAVHDGRIVPDKLHLGYYDDHDLRNQVLLASRNAIKAL